MLWPVSVLFFLSQDPLIKSIEGKDLFASYCASCHGMDGKGSGPASAAMKVAPPDLTRVSQRHKGKFPAKQVEEYIAGKSKMPASHGSSEMPVWGPLFHRVERDQDLGPVRLRNVVQYLESIQKTASK
jgi:mono/diheme cytochrome c family protein